MKHVDAKQLKSAQRSGKKTDNAGEAERLRELLNNMEQGVIVWGPDHACEFVSARVYEMIEVS